MPSTPLKREREKRELRTKDVADAVGVDQSQLYRIENGKARSSPDLANRLEKFFGKAVTRDQILFPEDYPELPAKAPLKKAS